MLHPSNTPLGRFGIATLVDSPDPFVGSPLKTASLRVNYLRQFFSGPESRYVGNTLRVGSRSGVGEARAIGADGEVALVGRLTAYR
jgi:acyl-coenzyme A thioesterase PaaI-like protein